MEQAFTHQVQFTTPERERELAQIIHSSSATEARQAQHELALSAWPMAKKLANTFARQGVPGHDLRQQAYLSLFDAAPKFDPAREGASSFRTFAAMYVRRDMQGMIRTQAAAVVIADTAYRIGANVRAREGQPHLHGDAPSVQTDPRDRRAEAANRWRDTASLDSLLTEDNTLGDVLASAAPTPEDVIVTIDEARRQQELVRSMLELLPENNRRVIEAMYGIGRDEPLSWDETIAALGQKPTRVSQLKREALGQLALIARIGVAEVRAAAAAAVRSPQAFVASANRAEMVVARAERAAAKAETEGRSAAA
jgi:RNA polymerase sigma factor (sigma-70 family)